MHVWPCTSVADSDVHNCCHHVHAFSVCMCSSARSHDVGIVLNTPVCNRRALLVSVQMEIVICFRHKGTADVGLGLTCRPIYFVLHDPQCGGRGGYWLCRSHDACTACDVPPLNCISGVVLLRHDVVLFTFLEDVKPLSRSCSAEGCVSYKHVIPACFVFRDARS